MEKNSSGKNFIDISIADSDKLWENSTKFNVEITADNYNIHSYAGFNSTFCEKLLNLEIGKY